MATELDTPIIYTKTVTTQKIDQIIMNIKAGQIEIHIGDYINPEDDNPYKVDYFIEEFIYIPEGTIKEDFRDVLVNVRAFARTRGKLGEGVDTDEIQ